MNERGAHVSAVITDEDRATARARAESIATRWVPAHMTARQGLVDDITASLLNVRELERDKAEAQLTDLRARHRREMNAEIRAAQRDTAEAVTEAHWSRLERGEW